MRPEYRALTTFLGIEQAVGVCLLITLAPTNEQAAFGTAIIGATFLLKHLADARANKPDYSTTNDHRLVGAGKAIDYLPPTATLDQFSHKANKYNRQAYPQVKPDNSVVFRKPFRNK